MVRRKLTQKGHNLFATVALVLAGILWLSVATPIFQVINFGLFIAAGFWWVTKTSYSKKLMVAIFGDEEVEEFEDLR
jgi:hypothetical protein